MDTKPISGAAAARLNIPQARTAQAINPEEERRRQERAALAASAAAAGVGLAAAGLAALGSDDAMTLDESMIINPVDDQSSDFIADEPVIELPDDAMDPILADPADMMDPVIADPVVQPVDMPSLTPYTGEEDIQYPLDNPLDDLENPIMAEELIDPNDINDPTAFEFTDMSTIYTPDGEELNIAMFRDEDGNQFGMIDQDGDGFMDSITDIDGNIIDDPDYHDLASRFSVDDVIEQLNPHGYIPGQESGPGIDDIMGDVIS